jgi:hypothetical protein
MVAYSQIRLDLFLKLILKSTDNGSFSVDLVGEITNLYTDLQTKSRFFTLDIPEYETVAVLRRCVYSVYTYNI